MKVSGAIFKNPGRNREPGGRVKQEEMVRSISPKRFLEKGDVLYEWRRQMLDLFDGLGRTVNAYPE